MKYWVTLDGIHHEIVSAYLSPTSDIEGVVPGDVVAADGGVGDRAREPRPVLQRGHGRAAVQPQHLGHQLQLSIASLWPITAQYYLGHEVAAVCTRLHPRLAAPHLLAVPVPADDNIFGLDWKIFLYLQSSYQVILAGGLELPDWQLSCSCSPTVVWASSGPGAASWAESEAWLRKRRAWRGSK